MSEQQQQSGVEPRLAFREVPRFVAAFTVECVVCGVDLSVHERAKGPTCSSLDCREKHLKALFAERAETDRLRKEAAENLLAELASAVGDSGLRKLPIGIMPSNDRPLYNLPERRKRRFRDRILGVISEAAVERWGPKKAPAPSEVSKESDLEGSLAAVLGGGCATCRGHCCPQGGDHAFLQPETILRIMRKDPDLRPREILDAFLSRLGNKVYRDSCVYHGEEGCRLPREMRSDLCNDYMCRGLNMFRVGLQETSSRKGFVVAVNAIDVVRSAILDGRGGSTELGQTAGSTLSSVSALESRRKE